ncbi:fibrobacter succinogenes major paralogous domain-containing protein [Dysgonomonas sp. Marseille-P4677]|uniref:FISUMP domain-containing protein n=1 Tax=Dysgonomonas sp. Marseille-P4677 TaxID=2364790 RepID=UPI00191442C5|nr:FISUMP domain-containing protein [Dysgonomonas sp. Marseille-P4677]MBK5722282.1 fibrobacter succinogenes major paralogous domain-containing protein [Dysgonomonas sp. Marseille-P4677]
MKMIRQNLASLLIITSLLWTTPATGQVTIGSNLEPNKGSLLDLKEVDENSTKGLGMPRVKLINRIIPTGESLAQTIAGNATDDNWDKVKHIGLMVYNTNRVETSTNRICPGIYVWDGVEWQSLMPHNAPLERKVLDLTKPFSQSFQYLESDPSQADFDANLWPADRRAAALNGEYKLGPTPKVLDVENNDYYTSRFYVGYKLKSGTYKLQRSYKCDPSATPSWEDTGEITAETVKIFTDGVWTTESMRTKTMPNGNSIKYERTSSFTEPRYYHPGQTTATPPDPGKYRNMGLMYNWAAATGMQNSSGNNQGGQDQNDVLIQGICPEGWHLPSDQEWLNLENGVILKTSTFSSVADIIAPMVGYTTGMRGTFHGKALKSTTPIGSATPQGSSKTAVQGGFDAYLTGHFPGGGAGSSDYWQHAYFWSASRNTANDAWVRHLRSKKDNVDNPGVSRITKVMDALINVRCIKTTVNN